MAKEELVQVSVSVSGKSPTNLKVLIGNNEYCIQMAQIQPDTWIVDPNFDPKVGYSGIVILPKWYAKRIGLVIVGEWLQ